MNKYTSLLYSLTFFGILICEGLGFDNGRNLSYLLIVISPIYLYLCNSIAFSYFLPDQNELLIPKKFTILYGTYILFCTVSTVFSENPQKSIYFLILQLAVYFVFIFAYNFKEIISIISIRILMIVSTLFCIYSLVIIYFQQHLHLFVPRSGYQFVYSSFGSHNHLGDFLMMVLLYNVYIFFVQKKSIYLFLILFFLPFMTFAYSRSAYLSFIVGLSILIFQYIKQHTIPIIVSKLIPIGGIAICVIIFFFITVIEVKDMPILGSMHKELTKHFNLRDKKFLANREYFNIEGFKSIAEKPLFGVGPDNFVYSSRKYVVGNILISDSSHNLLIDNFTENGVIAGISFLIMILTLFVSAEMNIFFIMSLALFINFQTDYTHRFYSLYFLFFVFLALAYKEPKHYKLKYFNFIPISIFLLIQLYLIFNLAL